MNSYVSHADNIDDIDFETLNAMLQNLFGVEKMLSKEDIDTLDDQKIEEILFEKMEYIYNMKHDEAKKLNTEEILNGIEKYLILNTVNEKWIDHIDAISALKDGIGLRAYAQTNPVEAYKIECFNMFEELVSSIQEDAIKAVFSVQAEKKENYDEIVKEEKKTNINNISTNENGKKAKKEPIRIDKKIGRNEPCPCGSGKKYKNCCGKNA